MVVRLRTDGSVSCCDALIRIRFTNYRRRVLKKNCKLLAHLMERKTIVLRWPNTVFVRAFAARAQGFQRTNMPKIAYVKILLELC